MHSKSNQQRSGSSDSPLLSSSLPRIFRSKSRTARYHTPLSLPSEIVNGRPGKKNIGELNKIVHSFRSATGFEPNGKGFTRKHWGYIRQFERIPPDCKEKEAIETISTPEVYASMRQGDRMRSHNLDLPAKELKMFCREIRAALVWSVTGRN